MAIIENKSNHELVSIDVSNAYNSLPRDAIMNCLNSNGVSSTDKKLLSNILNAAHSNEMDKIDTGTL